MAAYGGLPSGEHTYSLPSCSHHHPGARSNSNEPARKGSRGGCTTIFVTEYPAPIKMTSAATKAPNSEIGNRAPTLLPHLLMEGSCCSIQLLSLAAFCLSSAEADEAESTRSILASASVLPFSAATSSPRRRSTTELKAWVVAASCSIVGVNSADPMRRSTSSER